MRYLVWDFDGTLAERRGKWSGALLQALEAEQPNHGVDPASVRPFLQTGFPWHEPHNVREARVSAEEWWLTLYPVFERAFCEGMRLDSAQAQRLCKAVRRAYVDPTNWMLYEDVLPALKLLRAAGWRHVMLSNHVPELSEIVRALGISSYFDAIFNSAETGFEKPNPRAFQYALKSLDNVESVWMIGDSITADIKGANAVGLQAALVRKPHPDAPIYFETLDTLASFLNES